MTQFKSDIDEAQARVEAWWRDENLDRPVMVLTAPRDGAVDYDGPVTDDMDAWWTDPAYVLPRLEHQLRNTYYAGESMPVIYPVSTGLVSITNKYLGAPNVYIDRRTSWSDPIIHDWQERPTFQFDPNNEWWQKTERLLRAGIELVEDRQYHAYVGLPDLNGPTEVLSGLRGSQELALDFYDNPHEIKPALREVQDAWFKAYQRCDSICAQAGGHLNWMRVWSELPMIDLQSDVSCLISKSLFDEYFLPFIAEQAKRIDRTIYHLDGPDAVRHLDSLLAVHEIDAIQWVQGAGAGRTTEWIDLLKRIQGGGKKVWASCDPDEVAILCRELEVSKLLLVVRTPDQKTADECINVAVKSSRKGR
jgi:hypothetical protein